MKEIKGFIEDNWTHIENDLREIISINSVRDDESASDVCPFGNGIEEALEHVMNICSSMGFKTHEEDGFYGYAEMEAPCVKKGPLVAIMSHLDVVSLGEGWKGDGFSLAKREGFLVGRGIVDDKGPAILSIYTMKFWQEYAQKTGLSLPFNLRLIFGTNEESGMRCAEEYSLRSSAPDFMFTPDSSFSVGYAEKGAFRAKLESCFFDADRVLTLEGGQSTNAVPSIATAKIKLDKLEVKQRELKNLIADDVTVEFDDELLKITAHGKSAHAASPEGGVNAISKLMKFIIENNLAFNEASDYFQRVLNLLEFTDGSGVGIDARDEHFGALTVVGGKISTEKTSSGTKYVQTIDVRYPASTSKDVILETLTKHFTGIAKLVDVQNTQPYITSPDTPEVQALYDAFVEVSGITNCPPYTQGGGTYAKKFKNGVSFGPIFPQRERPSWVGGVHCANEAMSIDDLKMALEIYITAIDKLSSHYCKM